MAKHVLVINPGSTSTKLAVFKDQDTVLEFKVEHDATELAPFKDIASQFRFRKEIILKALQDHNFSVNNLDAVCGRGGMLKPIPSGTYAVSDAMVKDLNEAKRGEHASNLGALIARELADEQGIPSFIVDPVAVDELKDIARISGMPRIERPSLFHALNQKAIARDVAIALNKPYDTLNLVIAHLGGGISVAVHEKGRVIDVNNALDGEGPMSPERSGGVPIGPLYKMCCAGEVTLDEIKKMNVGQGGLVGYLGTNDARKIVKRIEENDTHAKLVYEAMAYQIAKEIGACTTVLKGNVDAIVLTGGLAYEPLLISWIKERISFLAPVMVFPGENELLALALGALRVLNKEEEAKIY